MGEGAWVLILEELEHALRREARIYAELVGYGQTGDAYHLTALESSGTNAARAMSLSLRDAGLEPSEVDYINPHGTSTPLNDEVETRAIKPLGGVPILYLRGNLSRHVAGIEVGYSVHSGGATDQLLKEAFAAYPEGGDYSQTRNHYPFHMPFYLIFAHQIPIPPSTNMICPVMYLAIGEAKKRTASATS
ncbi:hypothetical protein HKBW3S44_01214 [Candidatus Hakubella thermalkaliphila]|uniref:Ketosynthase family 3 (KS3) domain-containing protein n=1 Tax=Candidatus Hakubella thermalkaliphila TaxID=2754717 RepID=A0A6V8Q090_9ACTN|nr:hypothetical protein HKBW3S44_01214 [Candidatus Hakubella thermalkaliphila]